MTLNAVKPPAFPLSDLARYLPPMDHGEARLARVMFDRRFVRWVRALSGQPGASISRAPGRSGKRISMEFRSAQGTMRLSVPRTDWPALEMAARLPDPALARDVAQSLLAQPLAPFQSRFAGLVLHGMQLDSGAAPFEITARNRRIGLQAIDEAMAGQIQALLAASVEATQATCSACAWPAASGSRAKRMEPPNWARSGRATCCSQACPPALRPLCIATCLLEWASPWKPPHNSISTRTKPRSTGHLSPAANPFRSTTCQRVRKSGPSESCPSPWPSR